MSDSGSGGAGLQKEVARTLKTNLPEEFEAAVRWLEKLGIAYSRTRFGRYKETLGKVESARQAPAARIKIESPWVKNQTWYNAVRDLDAFATLFETNELVMIHQGLAGKHLETYLLPRLEKLVSGPENYVNENATKTNQARNAGFELAVIARLAKAGLAIQQHEGLADVVARLGDTTYVVECKRPYSKTGVGNLILRAGEQLETRYQQPGSADATGFIALDLTRVFNPQFEVKNDVPLHEMEVRMTEIVDALVAEYGKQFDRVRDKRTAGVLLRHSELAWIEPSQTMSWMHKYGVTPFTRRSPARVDTVWALKDALERLCRSEGLPIR